MRCFFVFFFPWTACLAQRPKANSSAQAHVHTEAAPITAMNTAPSRLCRTRLKMAATRFPSAALPACPAAPVLPRAPPARRSAWRRPTPGRRVCRGAGGAHARLPGRRGIPEPLPRPTATTAAGGPGPPAAPRTVPAPPPPLPPLRAPPCCRTAAAQPTGRGGYTAYWEGRPHSLLGGAAAQPTGRGGRARGVCRERQRRHHFVVRQKVRNGVGGGGVVLAVGIGGRFERWLLR